MKSSFYFHVQPDLSRLAGFSVRWAHPSLGHAGLSMSIFEARERLNTICLNRTSMAFLIILGTTWPGRRCCVNGKESSKESPRNFLKEILSLIWVSNSGSESIFAPVWQNWTGA
jgi:hypothetical protein